MRALVLVMALVALGWAQQPAPPASSQPAPQAAQPQPKRPQVKSKAEFDAYQAAMANAQNPEALEKSAKDFAAKFPDSELTPLLYRTAMRDYEKANDGGKLIEMGEKVLKSDPNDPEALVSVATVIAERIRDTDLDKDQRLDQAMQYAQRALGNVDTNIPSGLAAEQVDTFKSIIRSNAYSVMGSVQLNREKYADAEGSFKKALDVFPSQPDPVILLRLTFALDKQGKYPDALKTANQMVSLTGENTQAGELARREQQRLVKLTSGNNSAPNSNTPAAAPTPAPPKN
jgi:tetratricopeptide (TPR) repeat protein